MLRVLGCSAVVLADDLAATCFMHFADAVLGLSIQLQQQRYKK
jgi:hypothetical protein